MTPEGRIFRMIMVPIITLGTALAAFLALEVWVRIGDLATASEDNQQWTYSQLEVEYLKLDRAIDRTREQGASELGELRKRFDVFYSRVNLVSQKDDLPQHDGKIGELLGVLDAQIPLIDGPDTVLMTNLDQMQAALDPVAQLPRLITLDAVARSATRNEAERQSIIHLLELLALVVVMVTLALTRSMSRIRRQAYAVERTKRAADSTSLRLQTTLRASLDAVVVVDEMGTVIDYNGSAQTIFGYDRDEVLGQNFLDTFLPGEDRAALHKALVKFRETGETTYSENGRYDFRMLDRDGRNFPAEVSVSLARSGEGPIFVTYIRDITEKKAREAELVEAHDAVLEAFREKSRFFAMMSHEMRTPLNGVLSALQLLDSTKLDNEQRKFLVAAKRSGDVLLEHIDDVLAIERADTGATEKNMRPCDLTGLTAGLIGMMEPLARTNNVRLHLDQSGLGDGPILTDPRAIQQILVNLINNAIKFSPGGKVTLTAAQDKATDRVQFRVTDTGQGIPEDEISKIFDDFVSLDSRYERRTGGTGLGLGIVRRLVGQLGGTIDCTSTIGKGTTFTFDIPAVPAEVDTTDTADRPARGLGTKAGLSLLVVDDNDINRDLLLAMLTRLGHTADTAAGGQDAIDMALTTTYDAILMDISMPEVNGIQAARAIRGGMGANTATPIIAFTAHAMPQERKEFRAAGMQGMLHKPVDMQDLQAVLADIANTEHALHRQPATSVEPSDFLDDDQIAQLLDVLGREKLTERIATLIERMNTELPTLVRTSNRGDLQAMSHNIAGMCGMFGASRLHAALQEIEFACKGGETDAARSMVHDLPPIWEQTQMAWRQKILQ